MKVRGLLCFLYMKRVTKKVTYTAVFTPAEEGGYTATVPELPGCVTEGDTFEVAKKNVAEAIELYVETVKPKARTKRESDFVIAPVSVNT